METGPRYDTSREMEDTYKGEETAVPAAQEKEREIVVVTSKDYRGLTAQALNGGLGYMSDETYS